MKTFYKFFLIISCLLLFNSTSNAAVIEVPDEVPTIADAIAEAVSNDTILIAPGTYYEHLSWENKNIVIGSWFLTTGDSTYIDQTIIDGGENGRIMHITYVEGVSGLFGLTLTNGKAVEGAAIFLLGSKIRMGHLKIKNNLASGTDRANGGAIVAGNTKIFAEEVVIDSNRAICATDNSYGGAIYSRNSELYFSNSRISNNSSDLGGGIFQVYGLIELDNVEFERNSTEYPGGALALFTNVKLNATNSTFISNSGAGSALYASETQTLRFVNCLFTGNTSTAMNVRRLVLQLINCTLTDNGGPHSIWGFNSTVLHAMNTIFWNNQAIELNLTASNVDAFIGYCVLTNGEESIDINGPFDIFGPLWDMDPLFETDSTWNLSDYSPYIGAGLDSLEVFPFMKAPLFDIENNPRPMPAGSMPDPGAWENELGSPLMNIAETEPDVFLVFPNPARGNFIIEGLQEHQIQYVKIYNQRGELLLELEEGNCKLPIQLNRDILKAKGLLMIEIFDGEKTIRKKVLMI